MQRSHGLVTLLPDDSRLRQSRLQTASVAEEKKHVRRALWVGKTEELIVEVRT